MRVRHGGIGWFLEVVEGLHRILCEFIHQMVVFRRHEAIRNWRERERVDEGRSLGPSKKVVET